MQAKTEELTRKEFMKKTGVFISHMYFDVIIKSDYKVSTLSPTQFCNDWLRKNSCLIQTSDNFPDFKFTVDDDELYCLKDENIDPDNIKALDIIESLSEQEKYWYDKVKEQYQIAQECIDHNNKVKAFIKGLKESLNENDKLIDRGINQINLCRLEAFIANYNYQTLVNQLNNSEGDFNLDNDGEFNDEQ